MRIYTSTVDGADRRQHDRLYQHAAIRLITKARGSIIAHTVNLSDGGLLIKCSMEPFPKIGEIMEVQSMDFPDAPIKKVVIRRIVETEQLGLQYI